VMPERPSEKSSMSQKDMAECKENMKQRHGRLVNEKSEAQCKN